MKHYTDEELVERYYNVADGIARIAADDGHLDESAQCAAAFAALEIDLAAMRPVEIPDKGEHYGEQMWARVQGALPSRSVPAARKPRLALWRGLAFAAGSATCSA